MTQDSKGVIVQKYGGSSVANVDMLKRVAGKIVKTREEGFGVVVVISAMGNQTDELLALAKQVSTRPSSRELDMLLSVGERIAMAILSIAINDLGYQAISFTGSQSGIITDTSHTRARIVEVRANRITEELEKGKIVIVAGFQGVSREREITTLGRGGSDTTAIALAAALSAERCEIYSDVDGVYTADPRVVEGAMRLEHLSYNDMEELSRSGAIVMKSDAVEYARNNNIKICMMSSFKGEGRTTVDREHLNNGRHILGLSFETALMVLWGNNEAWAKCIRTEVMPKLMELGLSPSCINRMTPGGDQDSQIFMVFHNEGLLSPESLLETIETEYPSLVDHVQICGSVTIITQDTESFSRIFGTAIDALKKEGYNIIGYHTVDRRCTFYLPSDTVCSALNFLHEKLMVT
jgi:aspartate kinase